jgi:hypothetical protein
MLSAGQRIFFTALPVMLRARGCWITGAAIVLCACNAAPDRQSSIGQAYAGPATLSLHRDIDSKSPAVAIVHHGDKLDVVGQRRRWYKVRTAKGLEGWTSDRELLDTDQMARLRKLASETAGRPSQGAASTFSTLNVHTEPARQSPSFVQIAEHEKVDVIAHLVAERTPSPKKQLIPPRPKLEARKGKEKASKLVLPAPPRPPDPPADWLDLSPRLEVPPAAPEPEAPPMPRDDWTLIRTHSGQSGWVLTSALYLEIPDEVAQYAEGRRITSYFSLGKIADGDQRKDIWLWTTSERLGEDHDFDGYRVFVWSLRHHRYETAYIQRRERGFFPVLAKTGSFSVCLETPDGSRVRKQYVMMGNAVRPAGTVSCEEKPDEEQAPRESVEKLPVKKSFTDRMKDNIGRALKR